MPHIQSMKIRTGPVAIFLAGGYTGVIVLCILLIHLAGHPNVAQLRMHICSNLDNSDAVTLIATFLDLQISMYVLRGVFINGLTFFVAFGCLFSLLHKLRITEYVLTFALKLPETLLKNRCCIRYLLAATVFPLLAVINAYLMLPVGLFVFLRWLTVNAPIMEYSLAGLLSM